MTQHVITVQLKIGILDSKKWLVPSYDKKTQNEFIKFSKFYPMLVYRLGWLVKKNQHIDRARTDTHTHKLMKTERETKKKNKIVSNWFSALIQLDWHLFTVLSKPLSGQWTEHLMHGYKIHTHMAHIALCTFQHSDTMHSAK